MTAIRLRNPAPRSLNSVNSKEQSTAHVLKVRLLILLFAGFAEHLAEAEQIAVILRRRLVSLRPVFECDDAATHRRFEFLGSDEISLFGVDPLPRVIIHRKVSGDVTAVLSRL